MEVAHRILDISIKFGINKLYGIIMDSRLKTHYGTGAGGLNNKGDNRGGRGQKFTLVIDLTTVNTISCTTCDGSRRVLNQWRRVDKSGQPDLLHSTTIIVLNRHICTLAIGGPIGN